MPDKKIPQKSPYVKICEPGNYAWCSCGESQNQPYCDGSHKGSEYTPVIKNLEKEETVAWCGCKRTSTPPYCDGTHLDL